LWVSPLTGLLFIPNVQLLFRITHASRCKLWKSAFSKKLRSIKKCLPGKRWRNW
jgi:hypothetical protein